MTASHNGPATSPAGPSGPIVAPDRRATPLDVLTGHDHPWTDDSEAEYMNCPACRFEDDPTWRAGKLATLLIELAELRRNESVAYAAAFLAAQGTEQYRIQSARLATAELHFETEKAAANVAAYQQLLKGITDHDQTSADTGA